MPSVTNYPAGGGRGTLQEQLGSRYHIATRAGGSGLALAVKQGALAFATGSVTTLVY